MAALATAADIEDRLGRSLTDSEAARIDALLDDASAAVRLYTGRTFAVGETTVRRRVIRNRVRLTERPVTEVASVVNLDGDDVPFEWDGLDTVAIWPTTYLDGWERDAPRCFPTAVDITYTAGPEAVPPAIKAVVCQVAARAMGRPADESGTQQESIAGYSYSVGVAAAAGGVGFLNDEKAVLDRFRRIGGTAWVGP